MQCPRCGHNVAGNRESCMYCGAFVADQIPLDAKDSSNTGEDNVFVEKDGKGSIAVNVSVCLLYTSPSPRDRQKSRMPSSA
jgi:hypothetical protein